MHGWNSESFHQDGYAIIDRVFSPAEIEAMREATAGLMDREVPERVLETNSAAVRSIYNVHNLDELFGRVIKDPRMLQIAAEACSSNDVYVHQSQVNPKAALHGEFWDWHQDFITWSRDDAMPKPLAVNVGILLDDMTEFNGPLFVIPGSHLTSLENETAITDEGLGGNLAAKQRHQVSPEALKRCADENGIVSLKAPAGTVIVFHSNILHSSPPNLSPWRRTIVYIRYNPVSNALGPVAKPRPEWIASRDPKPLSALNGELLARS